MLESENVIVGVLPGRHGRRHRAAASRRGRTRRVIQAEQASKAPPAQIEGPRRSSGGIDRYPRSCKNKGGLGPALPFAFAEDATLSVCGSMKLHPDSRCDAATHIEVEVARPRPGIWHCVMS